MFVGWLLIIGGVFEVIHGFTRRPWARYHTCCCRLTVHKSVPAVRIHPAPPASLRFEAFSGEVRKPRACSGDAHGPSAPENAQMVSRCASVRFSLCGRVIRCRCLLLANATFGQEQPISRAMRRASRASGGRKALAWASPSEAWSRQLRTRGTSTNVPGYSTFRAVLCEHHESGSSMRRVSASAVRVVGCRPSTMASTISGARKAKRIKRPT
jgi:hypothetical protein